MLNFHCTWLTFLRNLWVWHDKNVVMANVFCEYFNPKWHEKLNFRYTRRTFFTNWEGLTWCEYGHDKCFIFIFHFYLCIRNDTKMLNFRYTWQHIFFGICESDMTWIWSWQTILGICEFDMTQKYLNICYSWQILLGICESDMTWKYWISVIHDKCF